MDELTIKIHAGSEGGYYYDIYDTGDVDKLDEPENSLDGGFCTTTLENALDMATQQAQELIKRDNNN